jgi:hypothetical protein
VPWQRLRSPGRDCLAGRKQGPFNLPVTTYLCYAQGKLHVSIRLTTSTKSLTQPTNFQHSAPSGALKNTGPVGWSCSAAGELLHAIYKFVMHDAQQCFSRYYILVQPTWTSVGKAAIPACSAAALNMVCLHQHKMF